MGVGVLGGGAERNRNTQRQQVCESSRHRRRRKAGRRRESRGRGAWLQSGGTQTHREGEKIRLFSVHICLFLVPVCGCVEVDAVLDVCVCASFLPPPASWWRAVCVDSRATDHRRVMQRWRREREGDVLKTNKEVRIGGKRDRKCTSHCVFLSRGWGL